MERTPAAAAPRPARSRAEQALRARHNWVQLAKFCTVGVSGYVVNTYYYFATQVQVMVEAFDERGVLLERRFSWVLGGVPPSHRTYFEVRNLPPADRYRVTVPYYTWQDRADGIFRNRF